VARDDVVDDVLDPALDGVSAEELSDEVVVDPDLIARMQRHVS
jgi:hypothetical protein